MLRRRPQRRASRRPPSPRRSRWRAPRSRGAVAPRRVQLLRVCVPARHSLTKTAAVVLRRRLAPRRLDDARFEWRPTRRRPRDQPDAPAVTDIATRSKPLPPSARTSKYCSPEKCATRDALPTAADPPGLAGEKCGDATPRSQRPSASAASAARRSSACGGTGCHDAGGGGGGGGRGGGGGSDWDGRGRPPRRRVDGRGGGLRGGRRRVLRRRRAREPHAVQPKATSISSGSRRRGETPPVFLRGRDGGSRARPPSGWSGLSGSTPRFCMAKFESASAKVRDALAQAPPHSPRSCRGAEPPLQTGSVAV